MLPNPIVVPAYADPSAWIFGFIGMAAEIAVVQRLLRRHGEVDPHSAGRLFVANVVTWGAFLVAVDRIDAGPGDVEPWHFALLEVGVVLAEALILQGLARRGLLLVKRASLELRLRRALLVSLLGNVVSILLPMLLLGAAALLRNAFAP